MKSSVARTFVRTSTASRVTLATLLCGALCLGNFATAAEKAKSSVADLRYGVALYHYYQQDYLQSLSELMVANARDGIHGHGDNPELIAGGVSLAFGMQNHAEEIFNRILQDEKRPQSVRDAAWFYLGKLQYARADYSSAEQSFSHVSDKFNAELLSELHALQINLEIKKNQFETISIKQIGKQDLGSWTPYVLYNLGSAHARQDDFKNAQIFLRELETLPLPDDKKNRNEYFTLLDKTYTAIGYSLLQQKSYIGASEEFNKVRLNSIESYQALLGYGWSAMAQGKYTEAIKPWQELQKRSLLNPAAQESLLALPFAYEKLNAPGDALHEYEHAEELLSSEISLVQSMRKTLTFDELLELIGSQPAQKNDSAQETPQIEKQKTADVLNAQLVDDGQNWLKINDTSIVKTRSMYLRELFARNEFQIRVLDLRDLLKLQKMLRAWQPKLEAYNELLQQKQLLRQQQDIKLAQQSLTKQEAALHDQRDDLLARVAAIKANNDVMALADDQTRTTYAAVERSEATIRQLNAAGQDTSEYKDRLRMFRGLLQWRAAQEFSGGISDNEMTIDQIDKTLANISANHKKINEFTAKGSDLQPLFLRIQLQQKNLQEQLRQVDAAIALRGEDLRKQVDAQLESHEKRLNRYLAQSHLAVARLYDTALRKQAQ